MSPPRISRPELRVHPPPGPRMLIGSGLVPPRPLPERALRSPLLMWTYMSCPSPHTHPSDLRQSHPSSPAPLPFAPGLSSHPGPRFMPVLGPAKPSGTLSPREGLSRGSHSFQSIWVGGRFSEPAEYRYTYADMNTDTHVCICVSEYSCACMCVVCICEYMCMRVCVHMYVCVQVCLWSPHMAIIQKAPQISALRVSCGENSGTGQDRGVLGSWKVREQAGARGEQGRNWRPRQ